MAPPLQGRASGGLPSHQIANSQNESLTSEGIEIRRADKPEQ
jgi:hypothetical protein